MGLLPQPCINTCHESTTLFYQAREIISFKEILLPFCCVIFSPSQTETMSVFLQHAAHTWEKRPANEDCKNKKVTFRLPARIKSIKAHEPRSSTFKKRSYAALLKVWLARIKHPRIAVKRCETLPNHVWFVESFPEFDTFRCNHNSYEWSNNFGVWLSTAGQRSTYVKASQIAHF